MNTLPLARWTWRAFVATTLLPLLLVELVLLSAYGLVSVFNYETSVSNQRSVAQRQFVDLSHAEARVLSAKLKSIELQVTVYADRVRSALNTAFVLSDEDVKRYKYRDDGVYFIPDPPKGYAGLFYSGLVPVRAAEKTKAQQTASLDPLMHDFVVFNPIVVQVYFCTYDSMVRIYPPIDYASLPIKIDLTSYNFYYLADAKHNPNRGVVWTDAYLDPAGAGWIISAIYPIYNNDKLEAVAGFDVTLSDLIHSVLNIELPWNGYAVLVDKNGGLLALPPAAEKDFGIKELTHHKYIEAIVQDTPKPEDFNLFKRKQTSHLATLLHAPNTNLTEIDIGGDKLVAWKKIDGPGWWLLLVVPQEQIYASANHMRNMAIKSGLVLLGGVLLFYAIFLIFLYRRSTRQVRLITAPLQQLRTAISQIISGQHDQATIRARITEIDNIAHDVVSMGKTLGSQLAQLKEQDNALKEAIEREATIRGAAEARTTFLAHISHEIRTPMNGIIGMLDVIDIESMDTDQKEGIEVVRRSAQSLLFLIDDLLEAVRAQNNHFELEYLPFDLATTIKDVVELFQPKAAGKGIELIHQINIQSPAAMGDPTRIRQVLSNLISNAIKFTHQGSITLKAHRQQNKVSFELIDTGIGIPPNRLKAIFDAFTQADTSTTRQFGGTGLGLTISASLVKHMGGELQVQSQVGQGSRFYFTANLPIYSNTTDNKINSTGQTINSTTSKLNILIAEDTAINQMVIKKMMERLGHNIKIVEDGLQALEAANSENFDIIILDVHMPHLDGHETAKQLKAQLNTKNIPILGLTASVMPEELRRCLDSGMDLVVSKPIKTAELDNALANLVHHAPHRLANE